MKKNKHKSPSIFIFMLVVIVFLCGSCSFHKESVTEPAPQLPALEEYTVETQEEVTQQEEETKEDLVTMEESFPLQEAQEGTEDPALILEEALNVYQDAQLAWQRGDLDTALEALDQAYNLILKINVSPDSQLVQQKDDIRLLIAQRIQEIYASRRTAISNNHRSIPVEENTHVLKEIQSFQTVERKEFEAAYQRSGLYREIILEELSQEGLPEQLSWMPMIESWFKVTAYSSARALGLWQFISSTGTRFGLKRDRWIDERMDFVKASRAAAKYLDELHSMFGDWTTALAAYNCGEFRVQRVINAQRINYLDNFWDLYVMLPKETARFVPRFIATLLIINDPGKYGFNLSPPAPSLHFETVTINRPVQLSALAKSIGLKEEDLSILNPELRYKSTPENEYTLRVPEGYGVKMMASLDSVAKYIPPEATYLIHYVRRGETVSGIAQRYGTSISAIARLNDLHRNYLIRPGQRLRVPSRSGGSTASTPRELIQEGKQLVYVVKRGDSLYTIANAFNTTVNTIKADNNLTGNLLQVGQKLTIQSARPEGAVLYTVKAGDIPYNIAKMFGMSLEVFLRMNGLSRSSRIYPGQKLWVIDNKSDK